MSNSNKREHLSYMDYNIVFDNKIVNGLEIERLEIGNVFIKSGKIVACDPLVCYHDTPPFSKITPKGLFPIWIYIAKTGEWGDRYALAKLEFNSKKAVKWVLATNDGDNIDELNDAEDFIGFPVDAGLGCFMDVETVETYTKFADTFYESKPNGNLYDDFFAAEFKRNADSNKPHDIGDWINFTFPDSNLNIVMFHSGYGDGIYPTYWGLDENDEIVSLVIDFLVIEKP